ncbi:MAG: DUF4129 domain-containing protein, partial [Acidimicrobiia bacterium]
LFTVVAVVATGLPGTESAPPPGIDPDVVADLVGPTMRLLYAAVLLAAIYRWLIRPRAARRRRSRDPVSPWATLAAMVVVAAVALLVLPSLHFGGPGASEPVLPTVTTTADPAVPTSDAVPVAGPDVWVLIAAAVAVLAFAMFRRRTGAGRAGRYIPTVPSQPPRAWIESSPDPGDTRSRVLAAYRRVAGRAAEVGVARAGSETVTSHLMRLAGSEQEGPTGLLADLYNRARFSIHPTSGSEATSAEQLSKQIREGLSHARDD